MQDWWRIAPMVFFALISYFVLWLLFIGALLQYLSVATQGETADQIASFNRSVRRYLVDIFDYLTYKRDDMPFPFGDFPGAATQAEAPQPHPGPAPTAPASATVVTPAPEATPKPVAEPAVTSAGVAKRAAAKSATPKPKGTTKAPKPAAKPKSTPE
jgi:hypothetical protein